MVFDAYNTNEETYETIAGKIRDSHAQFVYIAEKEEAEETAKELFNPLMNEQVQFQTEVVYAVDSDNDIVLKAK